MISHYRTWAEGFPIVLGIIGAVVGGYLGERFFGVGITGFNVMSFVVAVVGSLLVLSIGRLFMRG